MQNLFRFNNNLLDKTLISVSSVQSNTGVIESAHNWNILLIKPFVPNASFLYPLKTSENLTVF